MVGGYVELHAKSFYSFGEGPPTLMSSWRRLKKHGYAAVALTDTNMCGALEFSRLAGSLGIKPITGGELTLTDGSRLVLLAKTRQGYANISRLFTLANGVDRREPRLDPAHLPAHAEGVIVLAGGRDGHLARLAVDGRGENASDLLKSYLEWYGSESVYVELQQNFLKGDTARNRALTNVAQDLGVPQVATNDVHYHSPERYKLQARPGCRQAQHHHRPGPPLHQAQPPPPSEAPGADGAAVSAVSRSTLQHPPHRRAVRLRPQFRPGLHPPGACGASMTRSAALGPSSCLGSR